MCVCTDTDTHLCPRNVCNASTSTNIDLHNKNPEIKSIILLHTIIIIWYCRNLIISQFWLPWRGSFPTQSRCMYYRGDYYARPNISKIQIQMECARFRKQDLHGEQPAVVDQTGTCSLLLQTWWWYQCGILVELVEFGSWTGNSVALMHPVWLEHFRGIGQLISVRALTSIF